MKTALAVLDTMWGAPGRAPRWFEINPRNHSGARLLKLTGADRVLVTNACPQQTGHANTHGTPSAVWLAGSLAALSARYRRLPLLVCGKVAQATYDAVPRSQRHRGPVVRLLHPAARTWTKAELARVQRQLHTLL
jgi:hypothetical protein